MPREASRSKNSKVKVKENPKYAIFREIKLQLPEDPFLYKVRRVKWLLTNYSRALESDPTAISTKDYFTILDEYTKLCEKAIKLGLHTREGRKQIKSRVDTRTVAKNVQEQDVSSEHSGEVPFSMGT